jgi:hypothetical protein
VLSAADLLIIFLTAEIFLAHWRAASLEKRGGFNGWGFRQKIAFSIAQKAAI